ncbi:hypothetical protein ACFX1S_043361 [Malus domestica]
MCKLISQEEGVSWNMDIINELFWEDEALLIQSIPLSTRKPPDRLIWNAKPNGKFTMNSAYYLSRFMGEVHGQPREGWYKCNFDVAWDENRSIGGVVVVIRNDRGDFVAALAKRHDDILSPMLVRTRGGKNSQKSRTEPKKNPDPKPKFSKFSGCYPEPILKFRYGIQVWLLDISGIPY